MFPWLDFPCKSLHLAPSYAPGPRPEWPGLCRPRAPVWLQLCVTRLPPGATLGSLFSRLPRWVPHSAPSCPFPPSGERWPASPHRPGLRADDTSSEKPSLTPRRRGPCCPVIFPRELLLRRPRLRFSHPEIVPSARCLSPHRGTGHSWLTPGHVLQPCGGAWLTVLRLAGHPWGGRTDDVVIISSTGTRLAWAPATSGP